jgi:hypothetical protein
VPLPAVASSIAIPSYAVKVRRVRPVKTFERIAKGTTSRQDKKAREKAVMLVNAGRFLGRCLFLTDTQVASRRLMTNFVTTLTQRAPGFRPLRPPAVTALSGRGSPVLHGANPLPVTLMGEPRSCQRRYARRAISSWDRFVVCTVTSSWDSFSFCGVT